MKILKEEAKDGRFTRRRRHGLQLAITCLGSTREVKSRVCVLLFWYAKRIGKLLTLSIEVLQVEAINIFGSSSFMRLQRWKCNLGHLDVNNASNCTPFLLEWKPNIDIWLSKKWKMNSPSLDKVLMPLWLFHPLDISGSSPLRPFPNLRKISSQSTLLDEQTLL